MKSLSRLLAPDRIVWLNDTTKDDCLSTLVDTLCTSAGIAKANDVLQAIVEREKLLSTGFGLGLAVPHAKLKVVRDFVVGLGVHRNGVDFDSLDKNPVHVLVMILGPSQQQDEYLKVLARVTAFLRDNRDKLLELDTAEAIYELTQDY